MGDAMACKPAAFFAFALAIAAGCQGGDWSPDKADLLFMSNRDGNAEIYLQRAGSSEWTNLTRHEGGDNWPAWSPDGERIAFQSRRSGNLDIWVMAADGSGQTQLTADPEPDYLPAWSPDGATIVFTSWRVEPGDSARAPHLYTMRADGEGERRLVAASLETSAGASYSPDGRWIVYSRGAGEQGANLFVAAADGRGERQLTQGETLYYGSPCFSPDGRRIACYAAGDSASALVVLGTDGSDARSVLATGHNWYPHWSPDGRWLVYTAAVDSAMSDIDVFAIPAAGGEPRRLANGPGREQEASWRPR
jgi:TolB protein